ncbi:MAG: orotate phosphoribosyltransferase-like protein [Thermoplasmata archaeon M11B2D]|nr:MAG: orotate phosphoribosyltransferase-like protein [Thermoplasmata archaeon M11B2D]PNX53700.1 MAG: orotate phosphoribosyltransferase-like protein [Thermoplasmata archaeon M9B2D]
MKETDSLIKKALKFKESGLTDYEIAEELNVSKETAAWLLTRGKEKKPEGELKVGWRSIGVSPSRIGSISYALSDIILEEVEKKEMDLDVVVGIAINGIPFALYVAEELGLDFAVFRPHHEKTGAFCSNYATIANKKVVLIDDVIGSGDTLKSAIKAVKAEKGIPVLCVCVLNKRSMNDVGGVPLRSLIRARAI